MIVLSTFIEAVAQILHMVINAYIWIVIISALISFVQPNPYNPLVQMLYRLTNPVYALVRRFVPTIIGGIDVAPMIVILVLTFLDLFLVKLLFALVHAL